MADASKVPQSMVIQLGEDPGKALSQLVKDTRVIMSPHTAAKLRERKSNKLRDFLSMAGPLSVSHLLIFGLSKSGIPSLRIAKTPRGPTLHFRIEAYSLIKDVIKSQRRPKSVRADLAASPLLVLNGFPSTTPAEKVVISMFQNMFPPISAQTVSLNAIKRILLLHYDAKTGMIELRHYYLKAEEVVQGSRGVRRLRTIAKNKSKPLPDLKKRSDISEYLLDNAAAGYTSESEIEEDGTVETAVLQATAAAGSSQGDDEDHFDAKITERRKKALRLTELGPRMRLRLMKIEEGVCDGKVLYHSLITKSAEEIQALDKAHAEKEQLKARRRAEQEKNVKAKLEKKQAKKQKLQAKKEAQQNADQDDHNEDDNLSMSDVKSDDESVNVSDMEDWDLEMAAEMNSSDSE
ncbi:hypothetical protein CANCADRAFT_24620 [Tortispora caseinolytica NRRL Y-17796]|uniref:Brix domain-containing protein n=1 Tax=Tortispora caseinolytica NRRL Y-17796 TaxID=767744 RepID=A0A1E4TFB6_9ASCO|nr:hypothetical protein CANCADRAFT_24620 [Tortispora caseinolytica NRRL Y-17796]